MNQTEFMKELEYLLQDIPDEDKEDALVYYRDYLEEAGPEHESDVICEFGSPERVASIIRSDLNGHLDEGGEFTESGYQDERFKDPNLQLATRKELPDARPETERMETEHTESSSENYKAKCARDIQDRTWLKRLMKVGLLLLTVSILSPILLGIGGSVFGIAAGILCILAAGILGIGVLTVTACIGAVSLIVLGGGTILASPGAGVLVLGSGILILGCALIGLALSVLVYGQFLPFCIRGMVNIIGRLLHRGGRERI